jgi:hypothetical protein
MTLLLHLLQIPLAIVLGLLPCLVSSSNDLCGTVGFAAPLLIGVTQLVYMIPLILLALRRERKSLAKGLIIGAALTFLLNASCWGLLGVALIGADFR